METIGFAFAWVAVAAIAVEVGKRTGNGFIMGVGAVMAVMTCCFV